MRSLMSIYILVLATCIYGAGVAAQLATPDGPSQQSNPSPQTPASTLRTVTTSSLPPSITAPAVNANTSAGSASTTSATNAGDAAESSSFYAPVPTPSPGSQIDSAAGASGSSGNTQLGTGGLIAIIAIVACLVLVAGGAVLYLFFVKRKTWDVRKSIRRISRRVVGGKLGDEDGDDYDEDGEARKSRRQKRSAAGVVRLQSPPSYRQSQRAVQLGENPKRVQVIVPPKRR